MAATVPPTFRFLELPKELRLMVYDILPIETRRLTLNIQPRTRCSLVTHSIGSALISTCRIINVEAQPILDARLARFFNDPANQSVRFVLDPFPTSPTLEIILTIIKMVITRITTGREYIPRYKPLPAMASPRRTFLYNIDEVPNAHEFIHRCRNWLLKTHYPLQNIQFAICDRGESYSGKLSESVRLFGLILGVVRFIESVENGTETFCSWTIKRCLGCDSNQSSASNSQHLPCQAPSFTPINVRQLEAPTDEEWSSVWGGNAT